MAMWSSRKQGTKTNITAWYVCTNGGDSKVPKGYIPMILVGNDKDNDQGQRILVHVKTLREPCMEALLEMAAQQFGHGQPGILRIPCSVTRFEQMIAAMIAKANTN